jgi:hypothetical protein
MRKHNIRQLAVVEMLLTDPTRNFKFNERELFNAVTEKESRFLIPISSSKRELYELMDKYAEATLPDIDPPFKRILFWNEVRTFLNHL